MMTEKQEIRFNELKSALEQLAQDIHDKHWTDIDQKTKNELMEKFQGCLARLETALKAKDEIFDPSIDNSVFTGTLGNP